MIKTGNKVLLVKSWADNMRIFIQQLTADVGYAYRTIPNMRYPESYT